MKPGSGLLKYDLLIAATFVSALALFAGHQADKDAEITAAHVAEADARKADVRPLDRIALTYPLQCDATSTMRAPDGSLKTRCYQRQESR